MLNNTLIEQTTPLWAFLIGINCYQSNSIRNLRGCCNDVIAIQDFLLNQMQVPETQIKILLDEQATRQAIFSTFETFLIDNPAIPYGSQLLFYFSGHGSQMRSKSLNEPDGYDETIIAHDSRTQGIYDIPDKTLKALIDTLAQQKGHNITVIMDCCHAGSGTREGEELHTHNARWLAATEQTQPANLDDAIYQRATQLKKGTSKEVISNASTFNHVLLAACRDQQRSWEYPIQGLQRGLFTHCLIETLKQTYTPLTYYELRQLVALRMSRYTSDQNPQCEGAGERLLFGEALIQRDPFVLVKAVTPNSVVLDVGNITPGFGNQAVLVLYPASTRTYTSLPIPHAQIRIEDSQPTQSIAKIVSQSSEIQVGDKALLVEAAYTTHPKKLYLKVKDQHPQSQQLIHTLQEQLTTSTHNSNNPYPILLTQNQSEADLIIASHSGQLGIYTADDTPLIAADSSRPCLLFTVHDACYALTRLLHFQTIQRLYNTHPNSRIQGSIKTALCKYPLSDSSTTVLTPQEQEIALLYDPGQPRENLYVVVVSNHSTIPVYPYIFILGPDYSIHRLYPQLGQEEAIAPNGKLYSGLEQVAERLEIYLPNQPMIHASEDKLLVFASEQPLNLDMLPQTGSKNWQDTIATRQVKDTNSLQSFLDFLSPFRDGRQQTAHTDFDWGIDQIWYRVVRK